MQTLVQLAGLAQLILAGVSLAIPAILDWRAELRSLRPLTRQVFWVYAGYIWGTNVAFGLVSLLAARELVGGTLLAVCVSGFVALYWGARLVIQFAVFDRDAAPPGLVYRLAEGVLVLLFAALTAIYAAVALGAGS